MALQLPGPVNQIDLPAIDRAVQNKEWNALRMEGEQQRQGIVGQQQDKAQQIESLKLMAALGKEGMDGLDKNPNWYAENYQNVVEAAKARNWPMDKIPPATVNPEEAFNGFRNMEQTGRMGLAGLEQTERFEDVMGPEGNLVGQRSSTTNEYNPIGGGSSGNTRLEYFSELSTYAEEVGPDGKPTPRAMQAKVALGTEARAGLSADERIANDEDLGNRVASQAANVRFEELNASNRVQRIDAAFSNVQKLDQNMRNLDKAVAAIDKGANTGFIESNFFPNIKAATIELSQIQNMLGLDVIGSVTFGALSKGELDLALETALPTGLQEADLREWLVNKQAAVGKLRQYYRDQMDHLDQGGSVSSFLRLQDRVSAPPPSPTGKTATNKVTGEKVQEMSDGRWVIVSE